MRKEVEFAIFISVFIGVYFLIHFYVFYNIFSLFSLKLNWIFWLVISVLSVSYASSSLVEKEMPNIFTRVLYTLSAVWFGAVFILLFFVVIYDIVDIFVNLNPEIFGILIVVLSAFLVIRGIFNAQMIKNIEVDLKFDKIKKPIKIVQLSDLHLGTINTKHFMNRVVERVIALNPDFVVITGDLVDGTAPLTLEMVDSLDKIKAPIFFVIGNHEMFDDLNFVLPILKKTKLKILRNQVINHKVNGNMIQITGVDYYDGNTQIIGIIEKLKIDKDKFCILLNHAPTGFADAVKKGVDLELSGHTHKGQLFIFIPLVRMYYKYIAGLYRLASSYLFVSQGTGTWGPPMRLGTRSEIITFNLSKKN